MTHYHCNSEEVNMEPWESCSENQQAVDETSKQKLAKIVHIYPSLQSWLLKVFAVTLDIGLLFCFGYNGLVLSSRP